MMCKLLLQIHKNSEYNYEMKIMYALLWKQSVYNYYARRVVYVLRQLVKIGVVPSSYFTFYN